jgi:hypothetical protein
MRSSWNQGIYLLFNCPANITTISHRTSAEIGLEEAIKKTLEEEILPRVQSSSQTMSRYLAAQILALSVRYLL